MGLVKAPSPPPVLRKVSTVSGRISANLFMDMLRPSAALEDGSCGEELYG